MTTFYGVKLTGITVNVKKGEIHLSAVVPFSDENFKKVQFLDVDTSGVTLTVEPAN